MALLISILFNGILLVIKMSIFQNPSTKTIVYILMLSLGQKQTTNFRKKKILSYLLLLLSLQSCPTLCNPRDGSPPGSPVPGILQARTLEWVAISFSNAWKWSHSDVSDSWRPHGPQPTRLLHPWDSLGRSTGVGCHCLLWWKRMLELKREVR